MSSSLHIKLAAFNARYTHSSPALFYIRHQLEEHLANPEIEICQHSINENYHELVLQLAAGEPDAIFLSALIWNSDLVESLVADLSHIVPATQLVVGGPQAGIIGDKLGDKATIVLGEIEGIDPVFYADLAAKSLQSVYRGQFRAVRERGLAQIYRADDFPKYLANRQIYYETSRGCPFSCAYCLSASEVGVYHKPLEQVQEELDLIMAHAPKTLRFIDRTYNDNWQRGLAIWKMLMAYEVDTLFHFEIAPDFFTEEVFAFLETIPPGRFQFEIGIQSTNEQTLSAIDRKMKTAKVHQIVSRLSQNSSIHLHVDLILGLPYEGRESFLRSFEDVFAMGGHYIQMGLLKMLPNTPLYGQREEYGYVASDAPPYSVYSNNWLNPLEMADLYWFCECVEKFLNNRYFVSLWRYLQGLDESISQIFLEILACSQQADLFAKAATQELLSTILARWAAARSDAEFIFELLRYDWLRCGQKCFPEALAHGVESFAATRDRLYQEMAVEHEPLYNKRSRNTFFKRAIFWSCSPAVLRFLGLENSTHNALCFSREREQSVHRHQCCHLL